MNPISRPTHTQLNKHYVEQQWLAVRITHQTAKRICQPILDAKLHIYTTCITLPFQTNDRTQSTENKNFGPITGPTQLNPTQLAGEPNTQTTLIQSVLRQLERSCMSPFGVFQRWTWVGSIHGLGWVVLGWTNRETFLQWDVLSLVYDLGWLLLRSRPQKWSVGDFVQGYCDCWVA